MEVIRQKNLGGYCGAIILNEKLFAVGKNNTICIYSLESFRVIHEIKGINNPVALCSGNNMLYCITASNEFYSFDAVSWECISKFNVESSNIKSRNEWIEFKKIYWVEGNLVLGITLGIPEVVIIDTFSSNAEMVWACNNNFYNSVDMVHYNVLNNSLYIDYKGNYNDQIISSNICIGEIKCKHPIKIYERLLDYSTIYMDEPGFKKIILEEQNRKLKKTTYKLVYEDKMTNIKVSSTIINKLPIFGIVNAIYIEDKGIIVIMYTDKLFFISISAGGIEMEEKIEMDYGEELFVYKENNILALGWENSTIIKVA